MAKSKGKKYLSLLGNNLLIEGLKSLYNWVTTSWVKSNSTTSNTPTIYHTGNKLPYREPKELAPKKIKDTYHLCN